MAAAITNRRLEYLAALDRSATADPSGTKTGPFVWTGGGRAFSLTIPLQGGMDIRTRLTAQGATLKGRWEDVKGGNSGPVEMALAPRRP